ncbi:MAG: serine/threonine-protein kinase, partial [Planctomycetota bacterium]
MVTDDPKQLQQASGRTTLARLIAESPNGLDVRLVLQWADELAAAVDNLHARGRQHGSIDPSNIFIDEHDRAHLSVETRSRVEPTERDLLLGGPAARKTLRAIPARPEDDIRDLAATLYEALGGDRLAQATPASLPPPVRGVSVQINLALMAVLSSDRGRRVTRARDLARMLQGGPAPARRQRSAPRIWVNRVAITLMAAAAVVSVVAGVRLWIGPALMQRDEPVSSGDLLAADQEIQAALAARTQVQPPAVLAPQTEVESEAERIARRVAERAADAWLQALACAPDPWLHDDQVQSWCSEALAVAEDAAAAARDGRYEQASRDYELSALLLADATMLHDLGVADLAAEASWARENDRMASALNLLNEAASLADPEEIEAERVETNLAMAWDPPGGSPGAPPSASAPDPVEQTVDAVPPPVEAHADGPASHPDAAPVK